MKIAITHYNLTTESGDPRMLLFLGRELEAQGHAVTVYTARYDPSIFPELKKTFTVKEVGTPVPFEMLTGANTVLGRVRERLLLKRVYREINQRILAVLPRDLDVLVFHNDYSYALGRAYKKINPRVRTIWTMNNAPFYHARKPDFLFDVLSRISAWTEKQTVKRYKSGIDFVVVHDEERKRMAEALGFRTTLLYIPVDFEGFFAPVRQIMPNQKEVTLLGVGSLSPVRRFEDTIKTVAVLCGRGFKAQAIIIAKDFWKNNSYREQLLELVKKEQLQNHVHFYFEGVSEKELRNLERESHVFIFPNVVKIWGMAAFEAMAAGLPLVVSSVTSVAEVLTDGENSLFAPPGEPEEIANRVETLLSNPALYRGIAEAGQAFVKSNLGWRKYGARFLEIVQS